MFQARVYKSNIGIIFTMLELVYHSVVREVRKSHKNAVVGLLMNILQTMMFLAGFYLMFWFLGIKVSPLRGDILLYLMSGIFLFLLHTKAIGAVFGADGSSSAMMKHAPLNTIISISAAAIAVLYLQILSMFVIVFGYHVFYKPIEIENPVGAMAMLLLSWITGAAIGMIFLAVKPWLPTVTPVLQTAYGRLNMVASGKMFVANTLPAAMIPLFSWNPLFHAIDQLRGFVFINYSPHVSSIAYPIKLCLVLLLIGMMAEFFTRRRVSTSWSAGQ